MPYLKFTSQFRVVEQMERLPTTHRRPKISPDWRGYVVLQRSQ